jgi:hypothetical protein
VRLLLDASTFVGEFNDEFVHAGASAQKEGSLPS